MYNLSGKFEIEASLIVTESRPELQQDSLLYYLSLQYPIDLYPEKIGFTVVIPDLPGCMSQGKTIDEAMSNIDRAKRLWLETVYATDKNAIPLPSRSETPDKTFDLDRKFYR